MNTQRTIGRTAKRGLALLAVVAALGGVGLAARPMLKREDARAHALVDEGQRALTRGDRGAATLALERARFIAPRAGFVRAAITAAEIHDAETLATRTVRLVTSEEWSWLATALGWVAGLLLAVAVLRRRPLVSRHQVAASAGFVLAMAGVLWSSETSGAVVRSDALLVISPYADAAVVGPLPAGAVIERLSEHGTFVRVRSGDGLEGWVPRSHVDPIAGTGA